MNGIEKYIRENIEKFDVACVPEGSREIFMQKVKAEKRRRGLRTIVLGISSMAAAAAIAVCLVPSNLDAEIKNHHRRLVIKEMEIITTLSETSPELIEEVMTTIRAVVSEAIPLEDQLPDEIGPKEKKEILREYYNCKYKALEQIFDQYIN